MPDRREAKNVKACTGGACPSGLIRRWAGMKIPAAWTIKGVSYAIVRLVGGTSESLYCGTDIYEMMMEFSLQAGRLESGEIELVDSNGEWLEKFSR